MAILTRLQRKKIASPWVAQVIRQRRQSKDVTLTDLETAIQHTADFIETNNPTPPGGRTWAQVRRQADRPLGTGDWSTYTAGLTGVYAASTSAPAKAFLFILTAQWLEAQAL